MSLLINFKHIIVFQLDSKPKFLIETQMVSMSSSQLINPHFLSKDVALAQFSEIITKRIMVTCFRKVSSDGIVETSKYRHLRAESTLSDISDTIGINHRFL